MDKRWNYQEREKEIYQSWEKNGYFTPKIDPKKEPFTILLPPPNANDPLHAGHAMYVVEDILCRWHRMKGDPTLFLPGTDHAGIETQFVFEKKLNQEGKTRFDFDRNTLYKMIHNYVEENRGIAKKQLKQLGFSLDWTREKYTMDDELLKIVLETFKKLHQDDLIYRGERLVNYCTHCGTAFSELEIKYVERKDPLYYLKYGPFTLATTRPETKFGDTAVAVHPDDKRYKDLVGTKITYESKIGPRKMKVIADELVDPEFGTGAVKVTPAHDPADYEMAQKHDLPFIKVIDQEGKLTEVAGRFAGLKVMEARKQVVEELEKKGEMVKIDNKYTHRVGVCYKCGTTIEPLLMPQWFVKIKPLAKKAVEAVKKGETKIVPKRFEKLYFNWMKNIRDWNISRQIVWGPRIPAWYCLDCNPSLVVNFVDKNKQQVKGKYQELKNKYSFEEIREGLQSLTAPVDSKYLVDQYDTCPQCGGQHILQETDTFDTWFSSGQWPYTTLGYPDGKDFKYFYPTSVLDTMWDILFFWVARMMMFGLYRTGKVPFKVAHMHSRVLDGKGKKMSKSKGNVINPIDIVQKYGADSLRMALIYGIAPASDIALSEDKIIAMRNFANKIWNASRFIMMNLEDFNFKVVESVPNKEDKEILERLNKLIEKAKKQFEKYRFGQALEDIYQFFWHDFCDSYLESTKNRKKEALTTLIEVLVNSLKLIHPFAPFVSEAIYQEFKRVLPENKLFSSPSLMIAKWPK